MVFVKLYMTEDKTLTVDCSPVKVGGRARINSKIKDKFNMKEGELGVVSSEVKDILVSVYSDKFVNEGDIILRKDDIKKLNVTKGETVRLRKHESTIKYNKILDKLL